MSIGNTGNSESELSDEWTRTGSSSVFNTSTCEQLNPEHLPITKDKPTIPDYLTESVEGSAVSDAHTGIRSASSVWPYISPGLANSPWFRMAAQCYRVENLRDSNEHDLAEADQISSKWSHNDLSENSHATSSDWAVGVQGDSMGHVSSLVTEIKFDSYSGLTTPGTEKPVHHDIQSHGGTCDAAYLSKSTEHTHANLYHTLRDGVASLLTSSVPNESDTHRQCEEAGFSGRGADTAQLTSNRLPINSSRGPSLTVKIQMPLADRPYNIDAMHSDLTSNHHHLRHHDLAEELGDKHVHVKKPLNAFMLFMKDRRAQVMAECTLKESAAINQILGRKWHALSREEQAKYYGLARVEKERHQRMYPGWSARDNYACQVKRRKKRTGHESARFIGKSSSVSPRAQTGCTRQTIIPTPSVNKAMNVTVSDSSDDFMPSANAPDSRLSHYTAESSNSSVYAPTAQSPFLNEPPWPFDSFKHINHHMDGGTNFTDLYVRPDLMHRSLLGGNSSLSGRSPASTGYPSSAVPFGCCPPCSEIMDAFDNRAQRCTNRFHCGPLLSGYLRSTQEGSVTSLKLALEQDDRKSPCFHSTIRCPHEDPLLKFNVPLQARESLLHPSTQLPSESLSFDSACTRFGLNSGDRLIKATCAPVPDLLQSTRGPDLTARFSRSISPFGRNSSNSITSPPFTINQSHASTFTRSQTATNVAVASVAAAVSLSTSSPGNSEPTSVSCYEANNYFPGLYQSTHRADSEMSCADLSSVGPVEQEFDLYDKTDHYIQPAQLSENLSPKPKMALDLKKNKC